VDVFPHRDWQVALASGAQGKLWTGLDDRKPPITYDTPQGDDMRALPYVLALIVVVVGVDVLFLRGNTGLRLIVNIGIVALFAIAYLVFRK
jgi:hypothetical protein